MKKVIVTGGAGFIGSHLVDKLIEQGVKVIILDDCSTGKVENMNPKACYMNIDITTINPYNFLKEETDIDVVFHLAAKTTVQESIQDPRYYDDVNVKGTHNMLILANMLKVKRFIFSSSSSVYGNAKSPTPENHPLNPLSPYAFNKLIGEQYCKLYSELYGIETVCLRYFNVYGERQPTEGAYCLVMGVFAQQLLNGRPMTINGDGEDFWRRASGHQDLNDSSGWFIDHAPAWRRFRFTKKYFNKDSKWYTNAGSSGHNAFLTAVNWFNIGSIKGA